MSECSPLAPLRRDGTSQRQRMPAALKSGFVKVDERGTADLLLYAAKLAPLLKYYTEANEPAGNWAEFIERDVSTLAARVGAADLDARRAAFDDARAKADDAETLAARRTALAALFPPIFALTDLVNSWRHGAVDGLLLQARLDRLIEGVLVDALTDAVAAAKQAVALGATVALPGTARYETIWGTIDPPPDTTLAIVSDDDWRSAVETIERTFKRVYETAKRLVDQAPEFLVDTLVDYPEHQPHAALFLAFLRLLSQATRSLNTVTDRHLDFFYQKVLQLVPRPAVADRVHVIFELAKHVSSFKIDEDTLLNAGKDATGVALVYGIDDELVANRATLDPIHGLKTVFVDFSSGDIVRDIHAASDADSQDGLGEPLATDDLKWPTFGSTDMPDARIGFAVASPMLWLAEGLRSVTVRLTLDPSVDFLCGVAADDVTRELEHNVAVSVTGAKGWVAITDVAVVLSSAAGNRFVEYQLVIPASEPAIVGLDAKLHTEIYDTTEPVLRVVLDNRGLPGALYAGGAVEVSDYSPLIQYIDGAFVRHEGKVYRAADNLDRPGYTPAVHSDRWTLIEYVYPYKYFERMRVQRLQIDVHVEEMRNVVLENDAGLLNPAKPFLPFGPAPAVGSGFLVGSWEAFRKPLTEVKLHLTWAGLPASTFSSHYSAYTDPTLLFTADVDVIEDRQWREAETALDDEPVFDLDDNVPQANRTITVTTTGYQGDPDLEPFKRFDTSLSTGFVRLQLNQTFNHEKFAAALAKYGASLPGDSATPAPKPPYTPTVSAFEFEYAASETVEYSAMTEKDAEDRAERLFQIGPFGRQEALPALGLGARPYNLAGVIDATPVPRFTAQGSTGAIAEGTLYLGLANLVPPQNLSLLFQMAEGSEDPDLPAQDVQWSYLTQTGWTDFAVAERLSDTTSDLIASGIAQFAIPRAAAADTTLLPAKLHWLRATVLRHSVAVPQAVGVYPQAAQASFRNNGNDPAHAGQPLPAGTIAKLLVRDAAVKSVAQPYSSFGNLPAESDRLFRLRVAERLRHKRRAITLFDYERLVLEKFPEVYKVRCLTHTSADSEYQPGSVRVVVVPDLRNRNAVDPLRPRLSLSRLEAIRVYLADIASSFAEIAVVNPSYEEVRARFNVRFRAGFDKGYYTTQLEQDIVRFLSPWLYDEAEDLTFGGRVHRSSVLNFIDEREYVDFVTDFEMDHIVDGETRANVEEAEATRSSAVIVPAKTHEIGDDIVACDDEPPTADAAPDEPGPVVTLPSGAARYLGNVVHRELHDLLNLTPMCQVDEIAIDRRFSFRRIEDAQALGYDFCAFCFGRDMSTR